MAKEIKERLKTTNDDSESEQSDNLYDNTENDTINFEEDFESGFSERNFEKSEIQPKLEYQQQQQQTISPSSSQNLSRNLITQLLEEQEDEEIPDKAKFSQVALNIDSNFIRHPEAPKRIKSKKPSQTEEEKKTIPAKKIQPRGILSRSMSSDVPKISKSEIFLPLISTEFMKSQIKETENINQKELLISCIFDYLCFTMSNKFLENQEIFKEWKEFLFDLKPTIENKLSKEIQLQYHNLTKIFQMKSTQEIVCQLEKFSKSKKIEKKTKSIFSFNLFNSLNKTTFFRKLKLKDSEKEEISKFNQ